MIRRLLVAASALAILSAGGSAGFRAGAGAGSAAGPRASDRPGSAVRRARGRRPDQPLAERDQDRLHRARSGADDLPLRLGRRRRRFAARRRSAATASRTGSTHCHWVSDSRLVCYIYMVSKDATGELLGATRLVAVDADGKNLKMLSREDPRRRRLCLDVGGGCVIDWLPGENGAVLMGREYVPQERSDDAHERQARGLWRRPARHDARFRQAGRAAAARCRRIYHRRPRQGPHHGNHRVDDAHRLRERRRSIIIIARRIRKSWKPLGDYERATARASIPYAVDPDLNVVYGFKKKDGRLALYTHRPRRHRSRRTWSSRVPTSMSTASSGSAGSQRVVGASYATEMRQAVYFDKNSTRSAASLSKALPGQPLVALRRFERRREQAAALGRERHRSRPLLSVRQGDASSSTS